VAEQALSTAVATAQKTQSTSSGLSGAWLPRLITGFVILLTWEIVVRAFAPAYVAKPTTVILAIPKVLTEPAFLQALGSTLVAVAEGLAITIVIGTILGLLMGRNTTFDRLFRDADDCCVATVLVVVRLF
jgi:ABC-type nitrate/sulfonate/bicarbonate transport system permease component